MHNPPDTRRIQWVFFRDVPKVVRVKAARKYAKQQRMTPLEWLDFELFAMNPGDAGGWIAPLGELNAPDAPGPARDAPDAARSPAGRASA